MLNLTTLVGNQKPQPTADEQTEQTTEPKEVTKTEGQAEQKTATVGETEQGKATKTEGAPTVVEIPEIRLTDGKVAFIDETHEKTFQTLLEGLNVVAHNVSMDAAKPISLEVSGKSDAGEVFQHTGTVVREPLKAEGSVLLQQIQVNRYAPYYAKQLLFGLEEGTVDRDAVRVCPRPEHAPRPCFLVYPDSKRCDCVNMARRRFSEIPALAVNETTIDVENRQ